MNSSKPILILEDDSIDVMAIKRAFKKANVASTLIFKENGEEGLKYLNDIKNELPSIILLDINMPKMNGLEFLKIIKQEKRIQSIPVIILTTSLDKRDKKEGYRLGAAGFINKSVEDRNFSKAINAINIYWSMNELL